MLKHVVTMRILSILLSLSMVLTTIGNGTAVFDCATNTTDAQGHGASYTYDKDSRLIKTLYSNGASGTTSYNAAGHVKNMVNRDAAGNVISEYAYTYYVSGSPATKTDASGTTVYTYDGQNRLKTATYSDGTKDVYTFDDCGNRLTKTFTDSEGTVTVTSYEYDKANRLTKSTEGDAATVYTYDNAGNLLTKTTGEKTVSHSYDLLGRLITYTDGEITAAYDYYTSNMRRSKTVNGEKTTHIWIGNDIAVDMGANAASYLKGVRLVWSDYGYYLYNSHGDVVQLLDENGDVIRNYDYDAFGIEKSAESGDTAVSASDLNPYRYSGEYTDRESGYNYLRARYYDPTIGRFITADNHWNVGNMLYGDDPIKFGGVYIPFVAALVQSGNLYVYCMNNPVANHDPSGDIAITTLILIGSIAAGVVAVGVTAYESHKENGSIDVVSTAVSGLSWFMMAYSFGMSVYSFYLDYCNYKGIEPITDVGSKPNAASVANVNNGGTSEAFCFVAGTSVLTAAGYVAIENINAGDLVYAWNEESGETSLKPVVETYLNETDELVHVFVGGEEIISTPSHPFYVPRKGWTNAIDLRAGDVLVLVNGDFVIVEWIQHEILESPIKVYNFQVTDDHTYFVGEIGMLVHNACSAGNGGSTGQNQIQTGGANQYSTHESSNAAFRAAKRSANIPMSEQPAQVVQSLDRMGKAIPGKTYIFQNGTEIMQHSAGHIFEEGISSSAHFNILGSDWHFFYK